MSNQVRNILDQFIADTITYSEAKDQIAKLYHNGYLSKSAYKQHMEILYDLNMVI